MGQGRKTARRRKNEAPRESECVRLREKEAEGQGQRNRGETSEERVRGGRKEGGGGTKIKRE